MKKMICALCFILASANCFARVPCYTHVNGYNYGYHQGYIAGENHQKDKTTEAVIATTFIAIGVGLVIYAVTHEQKDVTRLTYEF